MVETEIDDFLLEAKSVESKSIRQHVEKAYYILAAYSFLNALGEEEEKIANARDASNDWKVWCARARALFRELNHFFGGRRRDS